MSTITALTSAKVNELLAAEQTDREAADNALSDRIDTLEASVGSTKFETLLAASLPASWWKLDEGSGNFANSGSDGILGTAIASILRNTGGPKGIHGGAMKTLDTTGILNAGDVYDFAGILPFSLMVLHMPNASDHINPWGGLAGFQRLLCKENCWILGLNTSAQMAVLRSGGQTIAVTAKAKPYEWNMIAATYDGASLRIFGNGKTQFVSDSASITGNANPVLLGQEGAGTANWSPKAGAKFASPAIWNRALSLAELNELWEALN